MISTAFFVLFLACRSFGSPPKSNDASTSIEKPIPVYCKVPTYVSSHLNLAIEMIKNVVQSDYACESISMLPSDCEDVLRRGYTSSGIYKIMPMSRVIKYPIEVYCDMTTDKGGWTVIQRRGDFKRRHDYFFKDWNSYKNGFGDLDKGFWLGNDNIFALSNQNQYSIRFDMRDFNGKQLYAEYDTFWINDENHRYRLHIAGYSGDAGDSMTDTTSGYNHNGMVFSTYDKFIGLDVTGVSCAERYGGAWWYNLCHRANLNGIYHKGDPGQKNGTHETFADGINWYTWTGYHESLEWTEIKIRRKGFKQRIISSKKSKVFEKS